jgi:hypothetical protein
MIGGFTIRGFGSCVQKTGIEPLIITKELKTGLSSKDLSG